MGGMDDILASILEVVVGFLIHISVKLSNKETVHILCVHDLIEARVKICYVYVTLQPGIECFLHWLSICTIGQ